MVNFGKHKKKSLCFLTSAATFVEIYTKAEIEFFIYVSKLDNEVQHKTQQKQGLFFHSLKYLTQPQIHRNFVPGQNLCIYFSQKCASRAKGPFKYYVTLFWAIFDPPPGDA